MVKVPNLAAVKRSITILLFHRMGRNRVAQSKAAALSSSQHY